MEEGNSTLPIDNDQPFEQEEMYSSWALLILMTLLIGALWTSYYLQLRKIRAVHETVISIMAGQFCFLYSLWGEELVDTKYLFIGLKTGMIVGLVIHLAPGTIIQDMVRFKQGFFFNLLLPPIILNSGYELKRVKRKRAREVGRKWN